MLDLNSDLHMSGIRHLGQSAQTLWEAQSIKPLCYTARSLGAHETSQEHVLYLQTWVQILALPFPS